MIRAVFFDLDDTLFDHHFCSLQGLGAVRAEHPLLSASPEGEMAALHFATIQELDHELFAGRMTADETRFERFRRIFAFAGQDADADVINEAVTTYRNAYRIARRAVPGANLLLERVRERASVVVITNHGFREQQEKLDQCGLSPFVDRLVVPEHAGVSKPEPAIFRVALEAAGCEPSEAVMIGDHWRIDVEGALRAGIRPIWYNPAGLESRDTTVTELRSFEPIDDAIAAIFV